MPFAMYYRLDDIQLLSVCRGVTDFSYWHKLLRSEWFTWWWMNLHWKMNTMCDTFTRLVVTVLHRFMWHVKFLYESVISELVIVVAERSFHDVAKYPEAMFTAFGPCQNPQRCRTLWGIKLIRSPAWDSQLLNRCLIPLKCRAHTHICF